MKETATIGNHGITLITLFYLLQASLFLITGYLESLAIYYCQPPPPTHHYIHQAKLATAGTYSKTTVL